jgi:hypothetical protein
MLTAAELVAFFSLAALMMLLTAACWAAAEGCSYACVPVRTPGPPDVLPLYSFVSNLVFRLLLLP